MQFKRFLFHVGDKHFVGYRVTEPFFIEVEYSYFNNGTFNAVLNVAISFKSIGRLKWSATLAQEIEEAAKNNHANTYQDDISSALSGKESIDNDIEKELNRTR